MRAISSHPANEVTGSLLPPPIRLMFLWYGRLYYLGPFRDDGEKAMALELLRADPVGEA